MTRQVWHRLRFWRRYDALGLNPHAHLSWRKRLSAWKLGTQAALAESSAPIAASVAGAAQSWH